MLNDNFDYEYESAIIQNLTALFIFIIIMPWSHFHVASCYRFSCYYRDKFHILLTKGQDCFLSRENKASRLTAY
jgi:hypothetical protein